MEYVDNGFRDVAKTLSDLVGCADGAAKFRGRLREYLVGPNEFDLLKLALMLGSDFAWNQWEVHLALCDANHTAAPSLDTWARGA